MALEPNKLYGLAQSLAEIVKEEYGSTFKSFSKIVKTCKTDTFAQLLLSRLTTNYELGQLIFITNLILNSSDDKETILNMSKDNTNVKSVGVMELRNVDIVVVMGPKQKLRRMMKVMKLKWKLNV